MRPHPSRQLHRLVGAVFEFNGHKDHFAIAEIFQVVHLEFAFAIGLVPGLTRLICIFDGGAIMHVLSGAPAGHGRPEIIQHVSMEADALPGSETDDPYARTLILRQQRGADARIGIRALTIELGGNVRRPLSFPLFLGGLVEHGQSHGNSSKSVGCHI